MEQDYLKVSSRSPIVYWLNEEDVQSIAREKIGRQLNFDEVQKLIVPISENISWSEAIETAIEQYI